MHSGRQFRALLLVVLFTLAAAATTVYGAGANGQPSASFAPPHANVALKEPDQALWPDQWTPPAQDLETLTSDSPTGTLAPERLSELPHPASLPANSLATDRAALVALYHATGGDNWTNNENWLSDAPLGDWYGVTTDETNDGTLRVAGLSLSDNGLDGEIPPELGNLTHLQSLDLSGNWLTGEIPPELSNAVNTRSRLYAHAAKGTLLESGNLANLEELSLNGNQLSGEIPLEMDTLTNLEGLRLGNNRLTGCISTTLADVPSNDLDGLGLPPCSVPAQTGSVATDRAALVDLYNGTGGANWTDNTNWLSNEALGRWLGVITDSDGRVTDLYLDSNGLNGSIPTSLVNLTELHALFLSGNSLTGCIPSGLRRVPVNDFDELGLEFCTTVTRPPTTVGAATKIYWTDYATDKIYRSNLDGSQVEELVAFRNVGVEGIALDVAAGKMYWTEVLTDKIGRANLDGSQVEYLVTSGLNTPVGIALDVTAGKMYWTDRLRGGRVLRANLDGSQVEDLVTSGQRDPYGIFLDLAAGKVYWTTGNAIRRANLDGSQVETLLTSSRAGDPTEIALDVAAGKMYWTDFRGNSIRRSNLDGSQVETLISSGLRLPDGLELDVAAGKMYWTEIRGARVRRSNLDGSQVEDLVTSGLRRPTHLTLALGAGTGPPPPSGSAAIDRQALIALYNATDGPNWNRNGNWLSRAPLDQWDGVLTDPDGSGRVTDLFLDDNGLTGQIPRELVRLTRLQLLYISGNSGLTGCIPTDLQYLPENDFDELDLLFCDEAPDFPADRAALEALYHATDGLNWTDNTNWLSHSPVSRWYGVLTDGSGRVTDLFLDGNGLTGEIPPELVNLENLESLYLADNQLTGCIPAGLRDVENNDFDELDLDFCTSAPPSTDPCVEDLGTLTVAINRNGSWTSDCASSTKEGRYARFYTFTLSQEATVQIDLTSGRDTVLNLLEGAGRDGDVKANNDDVATGNTNSQIKETLEAGTYTIEATTFSEATTGDFTLNIALVTVEPPPPTPTPGNCVTDLGTLTATVTRNGSWATDCVSTGEPNTYARFYSFTLGQQTDVQIDLTSSVDTVLNLREGAGAGGQIIESNDDVAEGNTNSQITRTLDPGTYTVEATTYAQGRTGDFTLTIAPEGTTPDECATDLGALTASVTETGSWDSDCPSTNQSGSYAHYYSFSLGRQTEVTIDLTSSRDTMMYLLRGPGRDGAVITSNDDVVTGNTNSQIVSTLAAGTYTIEATTYTGGQTGAFTLAISGLGDAPPVTDACVQAITGNGTVSGEWAVGCESETRSGSHARFYTITLAQESEVTITLESSIDTYLYLRAGEAQSGATVDDGENDDHDNAGLSRTTDSQIVADLGTGTHTIEATTYDLGETGSFTLTIEGLGATQTDDECLEDITPTAGQATTSLTKRWTIDCTSANQSGKYARFYTFTPTQGGEVAIELESTDTQTYLYLLQGAGRDGTVIDSNSDVGRDNVIPRITADLQAGTAYTVEVIARDLDPSVMGSFTLSITWPTGAASSCIEDLGTPTAGQATTSLTRRWIIDCTSPNQSGKYARFYTFTLTHGGNLSIDLESDDADTYLYLMQEDGPVIRENDDVDGFNPRGVSSISIALTAGTYTIEAMAHDLDPSRMGSFNLTITWRAVPTESCFEYLETPTTGQATTGFTGRWTVDCPAIHQSFLGPGRYARFYNVTLTHSGEVTLDLESTDADLHLYLLRDLLQGTGQHTYGFANKGNVDSGNSNARITIALDAGTYTIEASTVNPGVTGSFTLTITWPPDPCVEDLGTLTGTVSRAGEWTVDCHSVRRDGLHFARYYTFSLEEQTGATIYLTSKDQDTYLVLWEGAGKDGEQLEQLADNDDAWGENRNSQIAYTLEAGTYYTVEATTIFRGRTGEFRLTIAGPGVTLEPLEQPEDDDPCTTELGVLKASATTRSGSWLTSDPCKSFNRGGGFTDNYSRYYTFHVPSKMTVYITLNSSDQAPALYLMQGNRQEAEDTPGSRIDESVAPEGGEDSYIAMDLQPGIYTLDATTRASRETGRFTLTIERPRPTQPPDSNSADWVALDALYGHTSGSWANDTGWMTDSPLHLWHGVWTDDNGRVSMLDLHTNGLAGEIPAELGDLSALSVLNLADNQLTGEIPKELSGLTKMIDMRLQKNQLQGNIPPELVRLSHEKEGQLEVMHLFGNNLEGCIPIGLEVPLQVAFKEDQTAKIREYIMDDVPLSGFPFALTNFFLGQPGERLANHFLLPTYGLGLPPCAPSPTSPSSADGPTSIPLREQNINTDRAVLEKLYEVTDGGNWEISTNWNTAVALEYWSGVEVDEFDGISRVSRLDLNGNRLKGPVPPELGNLAYLDFLNLGTSGAAFYHNHLEGPIPKELGNLVRLEYLDLSRNRLEEPIPEELGHLERLKYLNLSHNQLEGSIPKELGNLVNLHTLALNDNQLTGEIPAELGNIVGGCDVSLFGAVCWARGTPFLDLYLQENALRGEIPKELGNIGYLRSMTTKPQRDNDLLTGCVTPNRVLDTLRVGGELLTNWAVSAVKVGDRVAKLLKNLLEKRYTDELGEAFGKLISDGVDIFVDEIMSVISESIAQALGLGNVEDVVCKQ